MIVATSVLLASCNESTSLAGKTNSSETGNVLTARILDSAGHPLRGSRVEVIDRENWRDRLGRAVAIPEAILTTDTNGIVQWTIEAGHRYAIEATTINQGLVDTINPSNLNPTFNAKGLRKFLGNIAGGNFTGDRICLENTTHCGTIGATGNYSFSDLPKSDFRPVLLRSSSRSIAELGSYSIVPSANPVVDTLFFSPESLLLEDFEDGDRFGLMHPKNGSGQWWLFVRGATSVPALVADLPSRIVSAPSGKALQITTKMTDPAAPPIALLGMDLGLGTASTDSLRVFADISQTRFVRFRIKGPGQVTVMIQSRRVLQLGDELHLHAKVPLTGDWQDVSIPTSAFVPIPGSLGLQNGLTFASTASRTSAIFFQFEQDGDYFLDDLRLVGPQAIHLSGWKN